jgi:hypothetical protein
VVERRGQTNKEAEAEGLLDARGDSRCDRKIALMWASKLGMVSTVLKLWTSLLALS